MMTVHEVSRITGLSVRTLRYYDQIGLLPPNKGTDSGYRLYDDSALEKLQQIMLFRELEIPLKTIGEIMNEPQYNGKSILDRQIELLKQRREHIDNLITFATGVKYIGVRFMDFSAFDKSKLDESAKKAKKLWGDTAEYREFEEKEKKRTAEDNDRLTEETMAFFAEFGSMRSHDPGDSEVQAQVARLQAFFSENFYRCSDKILLGLGKMYAGGGELTNNIDSVGGEGTAEFVHQAIEIYCTAHS